jgi:hypothetical protein
MSNKIETIQKPKDMKKIIVSLALLLALFTGRTYAGTNGPLIPAFVNAEFTGQFADAKDVIWETGRNFYKATFDIDGKTLFAFFADNGALMGIAHNLAADKLPGELREAVREHYAGYWITDLFTYKNADEKAFVITVENADRVVVLKSNDTTGWTVYRSTVKN